VRPRTGQQVAQLHDRCMMMMMMVMVMKIKQIHSLLTVYCKKSHAKILVF